MATVAADRPRPASIWTSNPPNECPMMVGFFWSLAIAWA